MPLRINVKREKNKQRRISYKEKWYWFKNKGIEESENSVGKGIHWIQPKISYWKQGMYNGPGSWRIYFLEQWKDIGPRSEEVVPSLRQLDYNGGMSAIPLFVNLKKAIIELV